MLRIGFRVSIFKLTKMVKLFKALCTYCYNTQLFPFFSLQHRLQRNGFQNWIQFFNFATILYSGWVDWKFVCGNGVKLNWMAFIALENEFEFETDWEKREREIEGFLVAFNIVNCDTALQSSHLDRLYTYAGAECGCINCFETWEMELSILITLESKWHPRSCFKNFSIGNYFWFLLHRLMCLVQVDAGCFHVWKLI